MSNYASYNKLILKQAVLPTPQLYDELIEESMENLATVSLVQISPIRSGAIIRE